MLGFDQLVAFLPSVLAALFTLFLMLGTYRFIRQYWDRSVNRDILNGVIQVFVFLIGVTTTILILPIDQTTRENILTFGGLLLTGILAFSSTTVIRDAAAGITLRIIAPFSRGDYLETDNVFGRISEIGFFHTEVQTEDRSLVTMMNSNLLSQDFRTIPTSGTLLTEEVSIGYDVSRQDVEKALLEAAEAMKLEDPFVHVMELGNFSITYRIAGLYEDFENILTARSDFSKRVLDYLHAHEIEIVSPNFMNRRDVTEERFIPDEAPQMVMEQEGDVATEVVFEKALDAQEIEKMDELITTLEDKRDELKDSDEDRSDAIETIESRIEKAEQERDRLQEEMGDGD